MSLLFLHGFMGAPAAWDAVRAALGQPRGARAPWLFGHGLPPRELPPDFWTAVDALATELREPSIVVGYSLGGRLALGLGLRHPARVRGVIAIGANPGLPNERERAARAAWEEELALHLEADGLAAFVDSWENLPLFATQATLPEAVRAAQREQRLAHDARALARVLRVLGTGHMPALDLERAEVPLLLVTGEHDHKLARAARAQARVPHRSVAGAGHNPLIETPDLLARVLDEQLRAWSATKTLENHP